MGSKKNTYSVDENLKLVELVGKYQADVLNVQKTGPFVNRHKNAAWEKIAEEFNQTSEMRRTAQSLRMRHENMKRELKKLKCHQSEDSETQVPIEDAALKQFDDLLQSNSNGLQSNLKEQDVKMERDDSYIVETLIDDEQNLMDFDLLDTSNGTDTYTYRLSLPNSCVSSSPSAVRLIQSNAMDQLLEREKNDSTQTSVVQNSKGAERNGPCVIDTNKLEHFTIPTSVPVVAATAINETTLTKMIDSNNNTNSIICSPFNLENVQRQVTVSNNNNCVMHNPSSDALMEQNMKIKERKLKLLESLQLQAKFDTEIKQKQLESIELDLAMKKRELEMKEKRFELDETVKKKELEILVEMRQKQFQSDESMREKQFQFDMDLKRKQFESSKTMKEKQIEFEMEWKQKLFGLDEMLKGIDMEIKKLQFENLEISNNNNNY